MLRCIRKCAPFVQKPPWMWECREHERQVQWKSNLLSGNIEDRHFPGFSNPFLMCSSRKSVSSLGSRSPSWTVYQNPWLEEWVEWDVLQQQRGHSHGHSLAYPQPIFKRIRIVGGGLKMHAVEKVSSIWNIIAKKMRRISALAWRCHNNSHRLIWGRTADDDAPMKLLACSKPFFYTIHCMIPNLFLNDITLFFHFSLQTNF